MLEADYSLHRRAVNHSFHRNHPPDSPSILKCEVNGELLSIVMTWNNYHPPAYCPNCGKFLSPSDENLYLYN